MYIRAGKLLVAHCNLLLRHKLRDTRGNLLSGGILINSVSTYSTSLPWFLRPDQRGYMCLQIQRIANIICMHAIPGKSLDSGTRASCLSFLSEKHYLRIKSHGRARFGMHREPWGWLSARLAVLPQPIGSADARHRVKLQWLHNFSEVFF